ncbi:MAG: hypothetical protein QXX41_07915 [Nitrososphaerota archaeon]
MSGSELVELLKYIQEREENLSRYSDKLRRSLVKISNAFGSKDFCMICDRLQRYHTDVKDHEFKAKVYVSIDVLDDEPFYTEYDEYGTFDYYLAIRGHELIIQVKVNREETICKGFGEVSRELLKALVKSKRLIPFLKKVADELERVGKEYKEVSEIAEKMASVI